MEYMKYLILFLCLINISHAQDLTNERIRKISGTKKSVYFKRGVFLSSVKKTESKLKAIRHGYKSSNGYERLVFDFETTKAPKVYGYKSENEKKIFIDFFNTSLAKQVQSFGNSKLVDKVEFYPVGDETLSTEVSLKENYSIDVFFLQNPGRVVIDIKN